MSSDDARGVIFDVDGVLRWGSLRRLLGRLRALRTTVFGIVVRCWPCPGWSAPFRLIWAARECTT